VDYRDDLLNLRTACKLQLPHLTEGGVDQAAAAERQKKKTLPTSQPPGETATEILLICHARTAGAVTPELKLRLKFYCS
jgi:hypothetical protein